ncbi:hypothetical protein MMC28_011343 [Mycoblastus sanguinarius]|nr:hypothetical protein [Mycoblastus sanguinarius]
MSLKDKNQPQKNWTTNAVTASNQYSVSDFLLMRNKVPRSRSLTNVDGLQYDQKDEDEIPEKERKGHVDAYQKAAEAEKIARM